MARKMKDSGVEWIGNVPQEWHLMSLKSIIGKISSGSWGTDGKYPLDTICLRVADFDYDKGVFANTPVHKLTYRKYSKDINDMLLKKGDIVIEKSGGGEKTPVGRTVIFDKEYKACFSNFMCSLTIEKRLANSKYVEYYFKSLYGCNVTPYYINQTTGIQNLQLHDMLSNEKIFLPPLSEQQKIADYLDEKVKEIDNAIEKTKETIELYKKYKQAIITEVVTKGLDPNTKLNVINVKGINKIPKTWSIADFTKVNYIRGRLGWKGLKADEYVDQGYPFLSAFNIINDKLSWNNLNFITKERYDESPEIKLKENDLLLVKDGNGIGKCAFIDSLPLGEATVNSSLAVITPIDFVHYKYEYYFFLSTIFQNVIWHLKNGMGVPHLTQESMKNIKMPLPPIKEQIKIASYLDNKCNYIDKVISKEESIIIMLENYKKSLIYECVTGKRSI